MVDLEKDGRDVYCVPRRSEVLLEDTQAMVSRLDWLIMQLEACR